MLDPAEIALELARTEREALHKINKRIASQQLGEAWVERHRLNCDCLECHLARRRIA